MKIAICDDLQKYLCKMDKSLNDYLINKSIHNCKVDKYDNPTLFLDYIEKNGGYDIVLLDICMPGISGTAVAHEIRDRHDKTEIIFVTTSDEFAVDAFALKAVHYLIKPYTPEE
ncbi:MAG: response regulator, partial [Clostridia bacterium]